jgi:hypothetical protein
VDGRAAPAPFGDGNLAQREFNVVNSISISRPWSRTGETAVRNLRGDPRRRLRAGPTAGGSLA